MRVLFIGGTGNISAACVRLAVQRGFDVSVLNRGHRQAQDYFGDLDVRMLQADVNDREAMEQVLADHSFDIVANFIAFKEEEVSRDIELFRGRVGQYFFISSASAYEKPLRHPFVTESTPLVNPFWEYSRDKIACEQCLGRALAEESFPGIIVRPSLTYDTVWPVAIGGWDDFTLIDRLRRGEEIVVHGDGTSLWTVTHADDFAVGFVGLFGNQNAVGHAFHITSDEVLTWDQIYRTVADAAGVKDPKIVYIPSRFLAELNDWEIGNLLGDKAHSAIFDNRKIKQFVPDFQARIRFHEGVRRTLAWFEADPARQVIKPEVNRQIDGYIAAWRNAVATLSNPS